MELASFPMNKENKMELSLLTFLAKQAVTIYDEWKVISTCGKQILIKLPMEDISHLSRRTHKEADIRCLLHTARAAAIGYKRMI